MIWIKKNFLNILKNIILNNYGFTRINDVEEPIW